MWQFLRSLATRSASPDPAAIEAFRAIVREEMGQRDQARQSRPVVYVGTYRRKEISDSLIDNDFHQALRDGFVRELGREPGARK